MLFLILILILWPVIALVPLSLETQEAAGQLKLKESDLRGNVVYLGDSSTIKILTGDLQSPDLRYQLSEALKSAHTSTLVLSSVTLDYPTEFGKSLQKHADAFAVLRARAELGQAATPEEIWRVNRAASDLALKAGWVQARASTPPMVEVKVNTLTEERKEVHGCEVWYVPFAYEDRPSEYARFDKLSTPTEKDLPVGRYWMWTEKAGRKGTRKPVSPGDDLKDKKEVHLPPPSES